MGNPFIGDASEGARLATKEWLLKNVLYVAEQLATRKILTEEYEDDDGPYVGPSGIAYALLRLSKTNVQPNYKQQADAILKTQANNIKSSRISESHKCRYLTGTLGFYTIQFLADAADFTSTSAQFKRLLDLVVQPGYQKIGDDEMLNGRAGFLAAELTARMEAQKPLLSDAEVQIILSAILKSGREYSKKHRSPSNLMFEWHDKEYLGAAHGLSSILQMLLSFWELLDQEARADVKQSVEWLLSTGTPDGNFPHNSKYIGRHEELVHWCHGAAGTLHLLVAAYLVLKEDKYLDAARKSADLIWERGLLRKGPGICHGVAGSGYAFLLLHRLTGADQYLDKAKAFAVVMMSQSFINQARTPDRPWSLFEGWAGALCFLSDLLQPMQAQFPLIPIRFPN